MATMNPFDLLGDDDNDDPSQLVAKITLAPTTSPPQQQIKQSPAAKLPSKPAPPAQAGVREAKTEGRGGARGGGGGGGGGGGRGYSRGGRGGGGGGFNRDRDNRVNNESAFSNNGVPGGFAAPEEGDGEKPSERRGPYGGPRGSFRGGGGRRGGGFNNGETGEGERPRRVFERRSGTGRGNELKREGSGRGNWGSATDEVAPDNEETNNATEKNLTPEKQPGEEDNVDASKENPVTETEEKEPEEKEMTLDEYEKIREEKRKALLALKTEERKVAKDKELESMQQLSSKKTNHEIFIKLGSDKDKKKEIADKDEKAKKSVSISEFLKPAEGERYYSPGGRGRGRGRGPRGGFSGGASNYNVEAPSIEDPTMFPDLKKK